MGAKTAILIEEYLHTSFPDLDREYRDGEVVERSQPDYMFYSCDAGLTEVKSVPVRELGLEVKAVTFGAAVCGGLRFGRGLRRWRLRLGLPLDCSLWADHRDCD